MKRALLALCLAHWLIAVAFAAPIHIGKPSTLVPACNGIEVSPCYVSLTADDIRTASDSELELLPAPGVGRVVQLLAVTVATTAGSIPFELASVSSSYSGDATNLFDVPILIGQAYDNVASILLETELAFDYPLVENKAILLVGATSDATGAVATSEVDDPGLGYEAEDTFTLINGVTGVVDTVGALGVVETYHLTANGSAILPAATLTQTATSGVGTGLTLTVLTITLANGTARVYVEFQVLPLP